MRCGSGDYRAEVNEYPGFAWDLWVPDYRSEPAQLPDAGAEAFDLLDRRDEESGHRLPKV
jgi:hypothetical protein